jgi:hypothetical protein
MSGENIVIVEELRNAVYVDEQQPNFITVSVNGSPLRAMSTKIVYGVGAPDDDFGGIGDYYINIESGEFYGPKTDLGWLDEPFFTAVTTVTQQNERHVHPQGSPSATWTITHVLGGRPSVTVVDTAGTVVIGEVTYNSNTQVTVTFTSAFSGFAYLT